MNTNPLPRRGANDDVQPHGLPLCTVMTPELAEKLAAVNAMTRTLRDAGVRIEHVVVLDTSIFIAPESARCLADSFRAQWRGVCWTTSGTRTRNMVTLNGVRIAWFTPVKEQDA